MKILLKDSRLVHSLSQCKIHWRFESAEVRNMRQTQMSTTLTWSRDIYMDVRVHLQGEGAMKEGCGAGFRKLDEGSMAHDVVFRSP